MQAGDATPALPQAGSAAGQWQVQPEQVRAFAAAVQQVRADLDAVCGKVDELTGPSYTPQLGTSPVGQQLTDKFNDRLAGSDGLLPQLQLALQHLDEFVGSAEQVARNYQAADQSGVDGFQTA